MRLISSVCFAAALVFILIVGDVHAQRVIVTPGYIRTPYAEVFRDPYGGKHVRTPFAEVDKPGYRVRRGFAGPPPGYATPTYANLADTTMPEEQQYDRFPGSPRTPTPAIDYGQTDWSSLAQAIREGVGRFDADLVRLPSGAFWKTSLKTAEIGGLVRVDNSGPPAEPVRGKLQQIANTFDALGNDPEANSVTNLASFRSLRAALREYVTPVDVRSRRQLLSGAAELNRSLDQFATAATWRKYFGLTSGGALAADNASAPSRPSIPELATVLTRFDSVSQAPQYSMIAELPAFQHVHELLMIFLGEQAAGSAPNEELPAPLPDEVRVQRTIRR